MTPQELVEWVARKLYESSEWDFNEFNPDKDAKFTYRLEDFHEAAQAIIEAVLDEAVKALGGNELATAEHDDKVRAAIYARNKLRHTIRDKLNNLKGSK